MMIYSVMSASLPFPRLDSVTASQRLADGERPDFSLLSFPRTPLYETIVQCVSREENSRPSFSSFQGVMNSLYPHLSKAAERAEKEAREEKRAEDERNGVKEKEKKKGEEGESMSE
jgi:hypothetical protein